MTDDHDDDDRELTPDEIDAQFSERITKTVAQLVDRYAAAGLSYEAGIDGTLKGAFSLALQRGMSVPDAAQLIRSFADAVDLKPGEADPTVPVKH